MKRPLGAAAGPVSNRTGAARRPADFKIDREGVWYYRGSPIKRESMVRLFAGMLCRNESGYFLRTPDQMLRIEVQDAPFLVTDFEFERVDGEPELWMTTSLGERFPVGDEHPLEIRNDPLRNESRLYLSARDGLSALVRRNVFYRLAEHAETDPQSGRQGVRSRSRFYPLH